MTEKATPGPWMTKRAEVRVDGEYDTAILAGVSIIAEAFGRSGRVGFHDSEANARLMAAAPALLAAVKALLVRVVECGQVIEALNEIEQARAAIAKAEGLEP